MFYIIFREPRSHFEKLTAIEKFYDGGVRGLGEKCAHRVQRDRRDRRDHRNHGGAGTGSREPEREMEKNQLGNPEVPKATSGNAAKRKAKAETQKRDQRGWPR